MYIHMAKKYLLYIHAPQFELEEEKSKLVNRLLVEYYQVDSKELRKVNRPGSTVEVKKLSNVGEAPDDLQSWELCKHDMVYGFCKKGCVK